MRVGGRARAIAAPLQRVWPKPWNPPLAGGRQDASALGPGGGQERRGLSSGRGIRTGVAPLAVTAPARAAAPCDP